jgi:hypothetical protein
MEKNKGRLLPSWIASYDLSMTLNAGLLVGMLLIAPLPKPETPKETDRSAGNISVYVFWPEGDTDIDTHMRDPAGEHVYFSRRAGKVWNLLRDDLGNTADLGTRNFENGFARGLPPGEYVVNVHAYRNNARFPVEVEAELRIQPELKAGSAVTFIARATLDHIGDEATMFRFLIDNDGKLVPGSVHNQFVPLAREDK